MNWEQIWQIIKEVNSKNGALIQILSVLSLGFWTLLKNFKMLIEVADATLTFLSDWNIIKLKKNVKTDI